MAHQPNESCKVTNSNVTTYKGLNQIELVGVY